MASTSQNLLANNTYRFSSTDDINVTLQFSVPSNCESWAFYMQLTPQQYKALDGFNITLNVYSLNDLNINVNMAGNFLAPALNIRNPDFLSQGYRSCRFPSAPLAPGFIMPTEWIALLTYSGGGGVFPFNDYGDIVVSVTTSAITPPMGNPRSSYRLPIRFILACPFEDLSKNIGTPDEPATLVTLVEDAIAYLETQIFGPIFSLSIYDRGDDPNNPNPTPLSPLAIRVTTDEVYGSDLYANPLQQLISDYQFNAYISVFVILNFNIDTGDPKLSPTGFSMITGPQGFKSVASAVLCKCKNYNGSYMSTSKLAKTIAHETCHYLGLNHVNACFDSDNTNTNIATCLTAASGGAYSSEIKRNVMYFVQFTDNVKDGTVGSNINPQEKFMLQLNPIVRHVMTSSLTPIQQVVVTIHTGTGFSNGSIFNWDGAGTDNDIGFSFTLKDGSQWPNPGWSLDTPNSDDFEAGSIKPYSLDPGYSTVNFFENLQGFIITKKTPTVLKQTYDAYAPDKEELDEDEWHLQGLTIYVNGVPRYNNDHIDIWLIGDDQGNASFADQLSSSSNPTSCNLTVGSDVYLRPSFIQSPVAPVFGVGQSIGIIQGFQVTNATWAIEIWVYVLQNSGTQVIVLIGDWTNGIFLRLNSGNYEGGTVISGSTNSVSAPVFARDTNTWIHLCLSFSNNNVVLFRNGVSVSSGAAAAVAAKGVNIGFDPSQSSVTTVSLGNLSIVTTGGLSLRSGNSIGGITGYLRNLSIWSVPKSSSDLQIDIFQVDNASNGLVGYWPLNEGDGDICYDCSAPSTGIYNVSLINTVWYSGNTLPPNTLYFMKSSSPAYVTIADNQGKISNKLRNSDMSIMFWAQVIPASWGTASGQRCLFGTSEFNISIYANGTQGSYTVGAVGSEVQKIDIPKGDIGTWVFFCIQYTQGAWIWWRNGSVLGTWKDTKPAFNATTWYLGGSPGNNNAYAIQFQNVWIFSSAVSTQNIRSQYMPYQNNGILPSTATNDGLLAFWPLNESAGPVIYDNSLVAPLVNGALPSGVSQIVRGTARPVPSMAFVDPGGSIVDVLSGITDASQSKPYNVYIASGQFPITTPMGITVNSWITVIGSGEANTLITYDAIYYSFAMSSNTGIRQLTAQMSNGGFSMVFAGSGVAANVSANNVTCLVDGYGSNPSNSSVFFTGISLKLSGCTFKMTNSNSGVVFRASRNVSPPGNVMAVDCNFSTNCMVIVIDVSGSNGIPMTGVFQRCRFDAMSATSIALRALSATSSIVAQDCIINGTTSGNITIINSSVRSKPRKRHRASNLVDDFLLVEHPSSLTTDSSNTRNLSGCETM